MLDTVKQLLKFDVRNRFTGDVQFTAEIDCRDDALTSVKLGLAIKWAIKSGANLSGAYLSGAYLSGANLSGAYLSRAYLSGANLSGAYLSRAYLSGANLSGAYLSRANLSGANLSGAYLSRANLSGANLSGAYLSGANLSGAYLSRAYLSGANLSGAYLSRANLSGANLSGANLSGANLSGAYLSRADLGADQWIIQGATRSDGYAFFLQKLKADKEPMVKAGCRYFTLSEAQAHWEKTRAGTALLTETRVIVRCMVDLAHARGLMKSNAIKTADSVASAA
ncbi:pentapeptide repeat-containing protein [Bradyrhizobium ivorense]|uniref:pentapeptide repeat-containing protein n=1 Tax=Bradyrhizobium ivorense TaxID=2511166 RepID=UPI0010BA494C|nr:pentapeptide repeat-containing protein [Bradyrhizobium ivorense]VIO73853.1 Secreted effector protein PipB2 [Bradyrhizobium ivorense]